VAVPELPGMGNIPLAIIMIRLTVSPHRIPSRYRDRDMQRVRLLAAGLALIVLAGCGTDNPLEPSTVVVGSDATLQAAAGGSDSFIFSQGSTTYGEVTLSVYWQAGPPEILVGYLSSYGIQTAEPGLRFAPEGGYSPQVFLGDPGSSYVLMTDDVPHYGRVDIVAVDQQLAQRRIGITFDWVVQTQAGGLRLY
jgi:hypothetical protein